MARPETAYEHQKVGWDLFPDLPEIEAFRPKIPFLPHQTDRNETRHCLERVEDGLQLGYYIGCDWVSQRPGEAAILVRPKLDQDGPETDVMGMLMSAMEASETLAESQNLLQVRFDAPYIELDHAEDLLSPFLVLHFLQIVRRLVHRGLRRTYYPVQYNLQSRVKGKILVADTLKKNRLRQKPLHTYCRYDEFGNDSLENRLIKRGLRFAQRYLASFPALPQGEAIQALFAYVSPAFDKVSNKVELYEIQHSPVNPFYPEYVEAIRLARLLIRRFGYQLSEVSDSEVVPTPPYWIDMSKLFELYVLGLLRKTFREVHFQFDANRRFPDYLLLPHEGPGLVADAKYKPSYAKSYDFNDIAQVSGYTRNQRVRSALGRAAGTIVPGLIIYPDSAGYATIPSQPEAWRVIDRFEQFFKIGVKVPVQGA